MQGDDIVLDQIYTSLTIYSFVKFRKRMKQMKEQRKLLKTIENELTIILILLDNGMTECDNIYGEVDEDLRGVFFRVKHVKEYIQKCQKSNQYKSLGKIKKNVHDIWEMY